MEASKDLGMGRPSSQRDKNYNIKRDLRMFESLRAISDSSETIQYISWGSL